MRTTRPLGPALTVVIASTAFLAAACSLLLNTNADQCTTDADCARFGPGQRCSLRVCVSSDGAALSDAPSNQPDGPAATTCNRNADCPGTTSICQAQSHACVALTTADCPEVVGDFKNDNAVLFGAILPTVIARPPDFLSGLQDTGVSIAGGLKLAVDDFAASKSQGLPPLPGKTDARPLAFVLCSDNESSGSTANATKHLVNDVGVPAIVGTALSSFTGVIGSTLTSLGRTDVLLVTPRSTDVSPTANGGMLTRLSPVDDVQGSAISALFADREASIRSGLADGGGGPLTVALVYKEDGYGNAVAAAVKRTLHFNGTDVAGNGAQFKELKYGNSDAADYTPQFASTTLGVVNAHPHAIILVGTDEAIPGILSSVEANWNEPGYAPRYFLSDGLLVRGLWDYLATSDSTDSTRKRILGTVPAGAVGRFTAFTAAYAAKFPQQDAVVYGAAGMYDAAYLLAYSAAGLGSRAITGPNLVDGFGLLASGGGALLVAVGPDQITSTFGKLVAGQAVNLDGASSSLDVDATSHAVTNVTTQVWCIPTANGHAQAAILSGESIDPSYAVHGTISAACGQ